MSKTVDAMRPRLFLCLRRFPRSRFSLLPPASSDTYKDIFIFAFGDLPRYGATIAAGGPGCPSPKEKQGGHRRCD